MKDYCYLNTTKMVELSNVLEGSEIKMLFAIIYCLNENGSKWFVNTKTNRAMIASIGFDKTPERISALLGLLVKKGVLKREANGVYSIPEDLFIVP